MKRLRSRKKERLVQKFHEHLLLRNFTPATITSYTTHVRAYLDTLNGKCVKKVSRPDIEAYIASLYDHKTKQGSPYSMNTIIVKVRALKRFFEFLIFLGISFIKLNYIKLKANY